MQRILLEMREERNAIWEEGMVFHDRIGISKAPKAGISPVSMEAALGHLRLPQTPQKSIMAPALEHKFPARISLSANGAG